MVPGRQKTENEMSSNRVLFVKVVPARIALTSIQKKPSRVLLPTTNPVLFQGSRIHLSNEH
jgi:hypothetical protein